MTYAMLGEFIETVGRADADERTVVIVVTGVPGAFCAGTDLADLATVPGETRGLRGSADEAERHHWWPIAQCAQADDRCDRRSRGRHGRRVHVAVRHPPRQPERAVRLELRPPRARARHRRRHVVAAADHRPAARAAAAVHRRDDRQRRGPPDRVRAPTWSRATTSLPAAIALAAQIAEGSPHSLGLIKSLVHEGLTAPVGEHMERHTAALAACFKQRRPPRGCRLVPRAPPRRVHRHLILQRLGSGTERRRSAELEALEVAGRRARRRCTGRTRPGRRG